MFDPRDDIIALFNNSRVSGSTAAGTRYVSIDLREDNPESVLKHDNAGVIILEPPETNSQIINIDGMTSEDIVTVLGNMWIKKERSMKNPDQFMNTILNTFQETIITNHLDLSGDCRLIIFNWAQSIPSDDMEMYRKTFMLTGIGHNIIT